MKQIQFRMLAYTAAAGKYDPTDTLKKGNEDNFYIDDDLSDNQICKGQSDETLSMTDCGILLCVADGMGGMNAGEVASQIAVDTVKDCFAPGKISPQLAATHDSRRKYMEQVIVEADERVKKDAKQNADHRGMGSTIILAWIVGEEMTVSWCGDSRAYRFNPATGIELLSCDHSYVQELANKGLITYDDTFDHPQGNIVTRSLGDSSKRAEPESRSFNVYDHDIILLCSDGLSGVLRDKKTYDSEGNLYPGDTIEDVMMAHHNTLRECREALYEAAEAADWYDNVTVVMCEIMKGVGEAKDTATETKKEESQTVPEPPISNSAIRRIIKLSRILIMVSIAVIIAGAGVAIWKFIPWTPSPATEQPSQPPYINEDEEAYVCLQDSLKAEWDTIKNLPEFTKWKDSLLLVSHEIDSLLTSRDTIPTLIERMSALRNIMNDKLGFVKEKIKQEPPATRSGSGNDQKTKNANSTNNKQSPDDILSGLDEIKTPTI